MSHGIVIVGTGVVGAATALALQKSGHKVTLIDREAPCSGASFGNAGAIVNGSCAPTSMPGIFLDAIRMLSQANSPLSILPSYFFKISPWLVRFIWQSSLSSVYKNASHLHAISQHAVASWRELTDNSDLSSLLRATGWLKVYQSEKAFIAGTGQSRKLLDKMGEKYQILNAKQIRELEPHLAPIFNYGFYQKDSLSIVDPQRLVQGMVDLFVSRGGCYKKFAVDTINIIDDKVQMNGADGTLSAERVVIAAGAWSRTLAKQLGDDIPLETERGYHLMLPQSESSLLSRPVVNGENAFVLSPMSAGLRMTSQVELAGLKAPPNYNKIRKLLPLVKQMLPNAEISEESAWLGFRPSLPDSLPVIGFATGTKKIIYAFGHQHLGMTLGAITGLIITDMINKKTPRVPIHPYRPNRFDLL
jgi:D-amino-acid dehydrogenase